MNLFNPHNKPEVKWYYNNFICTSQKENRYIENKKLIQNYTQQVGIEFEHRNMIIQKEVSTERHNIKNDLFEDYKCTQK